jgi:hypothetical protein
MNIGRKILAKVIMRLVLIFSVAVYVQLWSTINLHNITHTIYKVPLKFHLLQPVTFCSSKTLNLFTARENCIADSSEEIFKRYISYPHLRPLAFEHHFNKSVLALPCQIWFHSFGED